LSQTSPEEPFSKNRRSEETRHVIAATGKSAGKSGDAGGSVGDVLDNVTLYWLTNTAISSARLYWDTRQIATGGFFDVRGSRSAPSGAVM